MEMIKPLVSVNEYISKPPIKIEAVKYKQLGFTCVDLCENFMQ